LFPLQRDKCRYKTALGLTWPANQPICPPRRPPLFQPTSSSSHGRPSFLVLLTPAPRRLAHQRLPTSPGRAAGRRELVYRQRPPYVRKKSLYSVLKLTVVAFFFPRTGGRLPSSLRGVIIANAVYYTFLSLTAIIG
jgi:hypothetical protein